MENYDIEKKRHLSGGVIQDCGTFCEQLTLSEARNRIRDIAADADDELSAWLKNAADDEIAVDMPIRIDGCEYTIIELENE